MWKPLITDEEIEKHLENKVESNSEIAIRALLFIRDVVSWVLWRKTKQQQTEN